VLSQFNAENEIIADLLLDAGNSRLKWAWVRRGQLRRGGAVAYRPRRQFDNRLRLLLRQASGAGRVLICSVAGADIDRCIRRAARAARLPAPQFARSVRRAAGVTNAYVEPWRLGVDRWVAMIGARQLFPGEALCLVSVGTALTLDLLAASGRHRGGAIVPGPALMVQTLLERTAGIRRRGPDGAGAGRSLYARDTRAAIEAGARHACVGIIERALAEGERRLGQRPGLVLSGGGAAGLLSLLGGARRCDDLVMRGLLALAAGARAGRRQ
jgi:type III pantothenate kinase